MCWLAWAIAFLHNAANQVYCAEFVYICLNTTLYSFNRSGLTQLLQGDAAKAEQMLALQTQHNQHQPNVLNQQTGNPEFRAFHITMPLVADDLPPLDTISLCACIQLETPCSPPWQGGRQQPGVLITCIFITNWYDQLLAQQGQTVAADSLPFPPFKISNVIRRTFRTMLPRHSHSSDRQMAQAQARMFQFMEPGLLLQLGLDKRPPIDPKVQQVRQFMASACRELEREFTSYDELEQVVDGLMQQADDLLVGESDRAWFVPPRIYVDLGQHDGDDNLPPGWGFSLETVGALVSRMVIKGVIKGGR